MAQSEAEALRDKVVHERHVTQREEQIAAARTAHAKHVASAAGVIDELRAACRTARIEYDAATRDLATSRDLTAAQAAYQAADQALRTAQHRLANHVRTRPKADYDPVTRDAERRERTARRVP